MFIVLVHTHFVYTLVFDDQLFHQKSECFGPFPYYMVLHDAVLLTNDMNILTIIGCLKGVVELILLFTAISCV